MAINIKRLVNSFKYAFKGLIKVFREEQNFRVQIFFAAIIVICGLFLRIGRSEWALVAIAISIVLLMEVINSAVERITDALKPRIDKYAKEIKDIMAAAVFLSSLLAAVIGIIVFLPYFV